MTDDPITVHVLRILATEMPNVVKERGKYHLIVTALAERKLRRLGHVFNLRYRLANVIIGAVLAVKAKNLIHHLLRICHHNASSIRAILPSAIAGPTLMPTPVCINAALSPGATCSQVKGLAPRAP